MFSENFFFFFSGRKLSEELLNLSSKSCSSHLIDCELPPPFLPVLSSPRYPPPPAGISWLKRL